jgi:ribosomal protein L13
VPHAAYRQLPQHPSSVFLLLLLQIIGRLASYLSVILQGKDKPIFAPNKDLGDICVVVNAEKAVFTGNKWEGKVYKWHTGKQQLCWSQAASL